MPHQAVLPAPRRSRTRHVAFPHDNRGRSGTDARAARACFRPRAARLRARYPRRLRQSAGHAKPCRYVRRCGRYCRGHQWRETRVSVMAKIVPHLWYTEKAEEAAAFYASVLPNSKVDKVTAIPADTPSGPAGTVNVVEF